VLLRQYSGELQDRAGVGVDDRLGLSLGLRIWQGLTLDSILFCSFSLFHRCFGRDCRISFICFIYILPPTLSGHHLRHRLGGYIEIAHVEVGTVDHVERGRVEECARVGVCEQAGEWTNDLSRLWYGRTVELIGDRTRRVIVGCRGSTVTSRNLG
jgi:hypothetical protein